jgi:hypothetical protein
MFPEGVFAHLMKTKSGTLSPSKSMNLQTPSTSFTKVVAVSKILVW